MAPHSDATDGGDNESKTAHIDFVTLGMFIIGKFITTLTRGQSPCKFIPHRKI